MNYQTLPLNSLAMVIEDNPQLSYIFSQSLSAAGYSVTSIANGQEAINKLESIQPILVILDIQLPGASGCKVLDFIRNSTVLKYTWVIVATSEPNMAVTMHQSADLVLIKPVSYIQLRDLAVRFRKTVK